jgi:CubicO group peptidase (beta-lactamase class C family)
MEKISARARSSERTYHVDGWLDPKFTPVWEAFAKNFVLREQFGASVAITVDGRPVVDFWGGYRDAACTQPWLEDTICNGMSVGKGVAATCVHVLVDRGLVDLDAPVARYWPEFAANGKAGLLVRWVLDHRAGLPYLTDDLWPGAIYDWQAMTAALAAQAPLWAPGTQPAYHIRTFGFLLGEIVRRVTGKTLGAFFRDEIAVPLGIDFHIGLGDAEIARCAEFVARPDAPAPDPDTPFARAGRQWPQPLDYNADAFRRAEIPSSNGHGNARSVARFYSILANGGTLDGTRILSREAVARAAAEQYTAKEAVIGRTNRQALGFLLNSPAFPIGPSASAFGQSGMGGAMGFCDPDRHIAFGYIQSKMHAVSNIGPRVMRLIEATYRCV